MTDGTFEPTVSRRNLFGGMALGLFLPQQLSAQQVTTQIETLDPTVLYMIVRGLAMIDLFADPVLEEDGAALLDQIGSRLPEASLLVALYRRYRAPVPVEASRAGESAEALTDLHQAVAHARTITFNYTDLEGERSSRSVLPLAIVHPPQGIQLLGWCELRGDYRKFYVRAMQGITRTGSTFADQRFSLLGGLVAQEIPTV